MNNFIHLQVTGGTIQNGKLGVPSWVLIEILKLKSSNLTQNTSAEAPTSSLGS